MKNILISILCLTFSLASFAENEFNKSHGSFVYNYDNGSQRVRGEYQDSKRQGRWEYWFKDGKRMLVENYERGELQGRFTLYYENGNKRIEGDFSHNKLVGQWTYYNKDGSIIKTVDYNDGKIVKVTKFNNASIKKSKSTPGNITGTPDTSGKNDAQLKAEKTPGLIQ